MEMNNARIFITLLVESMLPARGFIEKRYRQSDQGWVKAGPGMADTAACKGLMDGAG